MIETTRNKELGIRWRMDTNLEDLEYDDVCLVSVTRQHIQEKTTRQGRNAERIGLKVNKKKTKVMRINTRNTNPIQLDGENLEDIETFTYFGSIVSTTGGTDEDIASIIN